MQGETKRLCYNLYMKKVLVLLGLFIVTFLGVMAVYHWDYLSAGRVLPPNITIENCDKATEEINKYPWDAELATAIMKAESKCDANAKGDTDLIFTERGREYGYSVGLFQVRILPGRESCDSFDIETNVKCAYDIYFEAGKKWDDWSMYANGKYRDYMWRTLW